MFTPPLTLAAELGDPDILRALLAHGAALEGRDYYDSTALLAATNGGKVDAVAVLLAAGADPNGADLRGQTPLLRAVLSAQRERQMQGFAKGDDWPGTWTGAHAPYMEIARRLLLHGAKTERADDEGTTPLFAAINECRGDFVDLLLRAGANVHHRDAAGDPVLPYLVLRLEMRRLDERGMIPIAERLLAADADPAARSASGHTAQELARLHRYSLLAGVLDR
jgi:hypothetical protein